ncbi:hypothetical protein GP486_007415 [Trichoglossum hirsutum]|uniref:Uncharacterized protein n=1 Tax=Trichoglossum hirsutum TaxID=265104 RepID=A0A9P8L6V7_9PEZI|nr:hypothetical protein GP486_007415 [Trichoglossum hirsutum]
MATESANESRIERDVNRSRGRDDKSHERHRDRRRHHHHHHHHHHRSSEHHGDGDDKERRSHRHKRSRHSKEDDDSEVEEWQKRRHRHSRHKESQDVAQEEDDDEDDDEWIEKKVAPSAATGGVSEKPHGLGDANLKRDAWMEAPSALDIDFTQRGARKVPEPATNKQSRPDFDLKIHKNELNTHLKDLAEGKDISTITTAQPRHEVDYTFGDSGSQWRMTKLKGVYTQAEDTGRPVEDIAVERFGDLRAFDDAREEQLELERRETYGKGYVGKEKPSGELFEERKRKMGTSLDSQSSPSVVEDDEPPPSLQGQVLGGARLPATAPPLDQTALNRLKAQMMKAKLRGSPDAAKLEAEYNAATASSSNHKDSDIVVLGAMESRMLAGNRDREVKAVDTKRGRERGLVEENEDMSIEDMIAEERRTKGQSGGDGRRFAERIAKDAKFDNDLDYLDENAEKLAKRIQKSEVNLKNTAINEFQKMNKILDSCPLCHREDTNTPPVAPVVSLATRVYLTLPTEPELSEGGACIVPIQHHGNLLECDDDEWEEVREAIISSDEEWTQHKKLIDTLSRARTQGLGKLAFRRSLVKEAPYFHVWFELDGGLGHIVEDANRWPKGDLFAREIIGGMLDADPAMVKKQGRWNRGTDPRVVGFRKRWRKFDWTRVLTDG